MKLATRPSGVTMYDSVTPSQIPDNAEAVAGYVNGRWPTFPTLQKMFPRAHKLSIAVNSSANAECLDIEKGDASPAEAPAWLRRQAERGARRPVLYTSVSEAPALQRTLVKAGIGRGQYRLWTAHYTGVPHRCSRRCGFGFDDVADATQYTDRALGRNLDASFCSPEFFGSSPKPSTKDQLRAKIISWRKAGKTWAAIKKTSVWTRFRKLGGK